MTYRSHSRQYRTAALTTAGGQRPGVKNADVRANRSSGTTTPLSDAAMASSSHPAAATAFRLRPPRR